jgi:ParB family transcriptional regulator, chromosome partitioning protein
MSRKVLGRGLSALLTDSMSQGEDRDGDDLLDLDIDLIEPNPEQPRTHFDETKLEELAQSIRSNGLVQPLLVRRIPGGRYQIVAGERRWRASQRAGLRKVSAVIRDISNDQLLPLALIENIQRQELNPVEEAIAYQKLIQDYGLTQDDLARQVGKDRSTIANHLRLLRLPTEIQRMLEDGRLSMGHARALLAIEAEPAQLQLAREIIDNQWSVRETEKAVKRATSEPAGKAGRENSTPVQNDANIRAAELKLKRYLGTQVRIHLSQNAGHQGGTLLGKIEIEFSSMSELDRLYSMILRKTEMASSNTSDHSSVSPPVNLS